MVNPWSLHYIAISCINIIIIIIIIVVINNLGEEASCQKEVNAGAFLGIWYNSHILLKKASDEVLMM